MPGRTHPGPRSALLIDDDATLSARLAHYLGEHGVDTTAVASLAAARPLVKRQHFDVVLLDLNLGGDDGISLLQELGRSGPPIIVVSARGEIADRVVGLDMGAVDYLVKPFAFRELLARIKVAVRGTVGRLHRIGRFGPWAADLNALTLTHNDGRTVELTAGEMALLQALLERPDEVVPRHELLAASRTSDGEVFERTVDVLISRLRRKVEADAASPTIIRTIRGLGYKLTGPVRWE